MSPRSRSCLAPGNNRLWDRLSCEGRHLWAARREEASRHEPGVLIERPSRVQMEANKTNPQSGTVTALPAAATHSQPDASVSRCLIQINLFLP